jgi:opacity protein-like surface antigen
MKKLFLLMLVTVTTVVVAQAQVALGLKAGASSSQVDVKNLRNSISEFKAADDITGYHAGAFLRLKAAGIILQPEAYFTSTGGKIEVSDTGSGTNINTEKFTFNRLDVPLLVGLNFFKVARVQAGPVASVLVSSKLGSQSLEEYMNKSDWGWQAGVGFDIGNFTADLRYENVKRDFTNATQNTSFDVSNNQFIFSLGFKLLGK